MKKLTNEYIAYLDAKQKMMRERIRNSETNVKIKGTSYYVSADGNDENDGLTPETAWLTPAKVSNTAFLPGDGVFFRRGDVFRGQIIACEGVTYSAYGEGKKP